MQGNIKFLCRWTSQDRFRSLGNGKAGARMDAREELGSMWAVEH